MKKVRMRFMGNAGYKWGKVYRIKVYHPKRARTVSRQHPLTVKKFLHKTKVYNNWAKYGRDWERL